jgi:hypothetical protein
MDQCISSLSPERQKLVDVIRRLYFGKIENLIMRNGDPEFSSLTKITQEIKLGPEQASSTGSTKSDFTLKSHVTDLLSQFDALEDGSIVTIECRHGLPSRLIVERSA